jgi:hypothetical protein
LADLDTELPTLRALRAAASRQSLTFAQWRDRVLGEHAVRRR